MCVIIVKKAGVNRPSKEILTAAAKANPDGFGFATSTGLYFRSTDFEEFWSVYRDNVRKDMDVVLHFRWATHGSVKRSNCHPFLGKVNGKDLFFAHNGVLDIRSKNDMTDSEICFRERLLPELNNEGDFTQHAERIIRKEMGYSKFAFVNEGGLHLYGSWINFRGFLVSNTRFTAYLYGGYRFGFNESSSRFGSNGRYAGVGI